MTEHSTQYAFYIAVMAIQSHGYMACLGRRILRDSATRCFRTIQLYDHRPARHGGHDPRAAGAAAVDKERAH